MIDESSFSTADQYDTILGTPSAQKIFRLLVCWEILPLKDIISKSKLDESEVNLTLKNLISIGLVDGTTEGIYCLADNKFSSLLKEAYITSSLEIISAKLYTLSKTADSKPQEEISAEFVDFVDTWKPLLEEHFSYQMSSLAEHLIDKIK